MNENKLTEKEENQLSVKSVKVLGVDNCGEYLFVKLDNGQKILTNGEDYFDFSEYDELTDVFMVGEKTCAVFSINTQSEICPEFTNSRCAIVDVFNHEVLLDDAKVSFVTKQDEKTLLVNKKIGMGNDAIFNVQTKKYLPSPENYKFERALGENFYVFRESDSNLDFYDSKRCVFSSDGNVILSGVEGWIDYFDNHLIISKGNQISVVGTSASDLEAITIKKGDDVLADPIYYDGKIILVKNGSIEFYSLDMRLIREIPVEGLTEVLQSECIGQYLELYLPKYLDGKNIGRVLCINLETGESLSHARIESVPYWTPKVFVCTDNPSGLYESNLKQYIFYDADFNHLATISGNNFDQMDDMNDDLFVILTQTSEGVKQRLFSAKTKKMSDVDYSYIHFSGDSPYGYGIDWQTDTMNFFDEDLNTIVKNVDYKKLGISPNYLNFSYFISGNCVCFRQPIYEGANTYDRYIILGPQGEVVLDSFEKCTPVGDYIQILGENGTRFMDTKTGKIKEISIVAKTGEDGKVSLESLGQLKGLLPFSGNNPDEDKIK